MIRLARTTTLLVAFSLLASAATAYAECAWVLWLEQTWKHEGVIKWAPIDSEPNKRDCESSRVITLKYQSEPKPDETVEVRENTIYKTSPIGTLILRWVCLPDTVDPRGPKGK